MRHTIQTAEFDNRFLPPWEHKDVAMALESFNLFAEDSRVCRADGKIRKSIVYAQKTRKV